MAGNQNSGRQSGGQSNQGQGQRGGNRAQHQEAGRLGGEATFDKYGSGHMSDIGSSGGQQRGQNQGSQNQGGNSSEDEDMAA